MTINPFSEGPPISSPLRKEWHAARNRAFSRLVQLTNPPKPRNFTQSAREAAFKVRSNGDKVSEHSHSKLDGCRIG